MLTKLIGNLKILPRWIIVVIDLLLIAISTLLAYLLRFNFRLEYLISFNFEIGIALNVIAGLIAILITQSYAGIIRYTSVQDSFRIVYTTFLGALIICFSNLIHYYNFGTNLIPYSVIFISFLSSYLFLFSYRILVKNMFSYYKGAFQRSARVMIYGAGELGMITRNVIETTTSLKLVGFLEDDERKAGKDLGGVRIYNARANLSSLFNDLRVNEIIIAINKLELGRKNELVDLCLKEGIKVRTVPPVEKWVKGSLSLNQIKDINIEDLLGRESIQVDDEHIISEFLNKKIMVTGAAGSIGSEIVRQLQSYGPSQLILVDQAETPLFEVEMELLNQKKLIAIWTYVADISNKEKMDYVFELTRPDMVFHAAAYKHVPMMEKHPDEAVMCNVSGTKILADLSVKYEVKRFVMISTDKAVNPTNVMGASKRIAELYVQSLNSYLRSIGKKNTHFITTRFGNVLGSNGSVIPLFKRQIAEGGPITVTHPDITRYFMTIPEACRLVLEASIIGKGGEIFLFDMGESVKIVDLAKKMVQLSGLKLWKDIEIVFTGLREGEKLREELLASNESTMPTHHPKIMIAKVREEDFRDIESKIDTLIQVAQVSNDHYEIVKNMKSLVPEFISNVSRFEKLDTKAS